jgi:hypothetical protein
MLDEIRVRTGTGGGSPLPTGYTKERANMGEIKIGKAFILGRGKKADKGDPLA